MVKENKLLVSFDATKKACFGVLPRYAKDELLIRWFELPSCYIFHTANAWEEEDEIVLISCRLENPDPEIVNGHVKDELEIFIDLLYEMRFNMKTSLASQRKVSASTIEFPRINASYTGSANQETALCLRTRMESIVKITGYVKFDLQTEPIADKTCIELRGNVQGLRELGPGRFGSEAVFVPKLNGFTKPEEEDSGYHSSQCRKSAINVIDAKTMSADPVG